MDHLIFLNKGGHPQEDKHWRYYRISTKGDESDNIEVCLVTWPFLKDIDVIGEIEKATVVEYGATGFAHAYPNLRTLLKNKWGIEHSDDDVIGWVTPEEYEQINGSRTALTSTSSRNARMKVGKAPKAQYRVNRPKVRHHAKNTSSKSSGTDKRRGSKRTRSK